MIRGYLLNRTELENFPISEKVFSEGRLKKIEKMQREEDKQLSASVELLLIYALKQLDTNIKLPLKIAADELGALSLETPVEGYDRIYFNLSHSRDYGACVISDKPIGIDIECTKTRPVLNMERILHPDEATLLAFISNPEEKKKYFYECWVMKESYLKNLGCGLTVRPNEFFVEEDKLITDLKKLDKRYVHAFKSVEVRNSTWKFDASYRMAICSMEKDPDTKVVMLKLEEIESVL